ncbi:MAG: shikimate kinase [Oscillospiraceae bacterium]|jgi:shikimate kinase|nr:shikimate kinase [Oscillospiraceae bacterium]
MKKNIYLTGFMGCGKTTIGNYLSKKIGRDFLDLDNFIVQKENRSIENIFETDGEEYFRKAETDYLKEISTLSTKRDRVIGLGGGTILSDKNAGICKKNGVIIFLELSFEQSYERIKYSRRPLVMNNSKAALEEIYNKRLPVYQKNAHFSVNADNGPFVIVRELKRYLQGII